MKSIIAAVAVASVVSGCGWFDRVVANASGYSTTCVEGLKVVQMASGAFYQETVDKKNVPCN